MSTERIAELDAQAAQLREQEVMLAAQRKELEDSTLLLLITTKRVLTLLV